MTERFGVARGDITTWKADAIITAASPMLTSREGLNGRIIERGGPDLLERLGERAETEAGDVYLTPGFSLPARHVLHAISPALRGGLDEDAALLEACYRKCFGILRVIGARTVGVAALGIAEQRVPSQAAVRIAVQVAREELARSPAIAALDFVVVEPETESAYRTLGAVADLDRPSNS